MWSYDHGKDTDSQADAMNTSHTRYTWGPHKHPIFEYMWWPSRKNRCTPYAHVYCFGYRCSGMNRETWPKCRIKTYSAGKCCTIQGRRRPADANQKSYDCLTWRCQAKKLHDWEKGRDWPQVPCISWQVHWKDNRVWTHVWWSSGWHKHRKAPYWMKIGGILTCTLCTVQSRVKCPWVCVKSRER